MKKKLNLDQLKLSSFVTDLSGGTENTVKGGLWSQRYCDSDKDCGRLSWPNCNHPSNNCDFSENTSAPFAC